MQRVFLLGVPIDALSGAEVLARLQEFLHGDSRVHVTTPNSEMLVEAAKNAAFRKVLLSSALNLPDSFGLLLAAQMTGQRIPERVAGADAVVHLCAGLGPEHPVFLLGAGVGIADRAADELRKRNPNLRIAGTYAGSPAEGDAQAIIDRINASGAHVLFVAYGAPAQDIWIARQLPKFLTVRVAMGVGGTFDFLAGKALRAPAWMRRAGLEWLWRLIREPHRAARIFRAVIVFPVMVLRYGRCSPTTD